MTEPVLTDKKIYPGEDIIFSLIGKHQRYWISLFDFIKAEYPDLSGAWKYYHDGKRWLFSLKEKSRTIFWLSLTGRSFQVTFYFNPITEKYFYASPLPGDMKQKYMEQHAGKKIKPVTVMVKSMRDIDTIKTLIQIKRLRNR